MAAFLASRRVGRAVRPRVRGIDSALLQANGTSMLHDSKHVKGTATSRHAAAQWVAERRRPPSTDVACVIR